MAASASCFRVVAPHRLLTRRWGEQAVVYDDRTGDTHLFGALAVDVLDELRRSPLDRDTLLERLGNRDRAAVDQVLDKLTELQICTVGT